MKGTEAIHERGKGDRNQLTFGSRMDELTRFASWKAFRSWFQSGEIGEEDRVTAGRGRSHTANPSCQAKVKAVEQMKRRSLNTSALVVPNESLR